MKYQLYLLNEEARIRAAEAFSALSDREAAEIGGCVHEACSDVFAGFEVWRGPERIRAHKYVEAPLRLQDVIETRQANILELEERLQRSFGCVARSKRLLEISAQLLKQGRLRVISLEQAESDVAKWQQRLAKQSAIIDRLERAGLDELLPGARMLLTNFENNRSSRP